MPSRRDTVLRSFYAVFAICALAMIATPMQSFPSVAGPRWTEVADNQFRGVHVLGRSFSIDEARAASAPPRQFDADATAKRGDVIIISGWALDPSTLTAAAGLAVRVDGGAWKRIRYGNARPDIPAVFGLPADATPCGFMFHLETRTIRLGNHVVLLGTLAADGSLHVFTLPVTVHVIA